MRSILVAGAAGAVGRRVVIELSRDPDVDRIVALDRVPLGGRSLPDGVEAIQIDLVSSDLNPVLDGVDTVIHVAEDRTRRSSNRTAIVVLDRLLQACTDNRVDHFVLLSSALVYGAWPDNPVPLTESQPMRPSPLARARLKAELERSATDWADGHDLDLCILRPAVALSEDDTSWIGSALRAAMTVRPEQVDPPVQFVHHDDLARAIAFVAVNRCRGIYNVASEGWIGADAFRALRGETEVRLPERAGLLRHRAAKLLADRGLLEGLEPYVTHPWVVATDKLQAAGWNARYTSEEVYILGTAPPLLASLGPQKRQEIALGAAGVAGAAAVGAAAWMVRRLLR